MLDQFFKAFVQFFSPWFPVDTTDPAPSGESKKPASPTTEKVRFWLAKPTHGMGMNNPFKPTLIRSAIRYRDGEVELTYVGSYVWLPMDRLDSLEAVEVTSLFDGLDVYIRDHSIPDYPARKTHHLIIHHMGKHPERFGAPEFAQYMEVARDLNLLNNDPELVYVGPTGFKYHYESMVSAVDSNSDIVDFILRNFGHGVILNVSDYTRLRTGVRAIAKLPETLLTFDRSKQFVKVPSVSLFMGRDITPLEAAVDDTEIIICLTDPAEDSADNLSEFFSLDEDTGCYTILRGRVHDGAKQVSPSIMEDMSYTEFLDFCGIDQDIPREYPLPKELIEQLIKEGFDNAFDRKYEVDSSTGSETSLV